MCGICGVIQVEGDPRHVVERETLDWMTDLMTHRGPDDRGTHLGEGVALGARRLSIVDVAGGHQPIANEDGLVWAVQNGELYNHQEIRDELARKGHRFQTRCDTEVIPHLYEEVGDSFAEKLRGKFAIAVWDGRRGRAVLVRDRLGIKPLYFARVDDQLIFASELKSVLGSGVVSPELDLEAIDAYLTFGFIPAPRTPIVGVSKLLPGYRLVVDRGTVTIDRYWRCPEPVSGRDGRTPEDWAEELLDVLDESVRLRLMSDVPLGAMLSGGLDSSLVVALMAKHTPERVKTFSVGFRDAAITNELADARFVADVLSTDHHELELSVSDQSVDLAELVWVTDEPLADLSTLGFLALSELASQHVTVALSGQGADELLGGYSRHRNAALVDRFDRLPRTVRNVALLGGGRGPSSLRRLSALAQYEDSARRLLAIKGGVFPDMRAELARGRFAGLDGGAARRAIESRMAAGSDLLLTQLLHVDTQLGLVDDMLHYFDRASMAHSLEVRVPFLDHKVVELCARVPPELKVHGRTTKYLLRRAALGLVPDRIIDKPKVGFFNGFVSSWFEAQAGNAIREYLLQPNPKYSDLLSRTAVEQLVRAQSGTPMSGHADLLFSILLLEVWLSSYLPRATSVAQPRTRERITA
jgi:asparagine synthase (glutamine-hydrolysing)